MSCTSTLLLFLSIAFGIAIFRLPLFLTAYFA